MSEVALNSWSPLELVSGAVAMAAEKSSPFIQNGSKATPAGSLPKTVAISKAAPTADASFSSEAQLNNVFEAFDQKYPNANPEIKTRLIFLTQAVADVLNANPETIDWNKVTRDIDTQLMQITSLSEELDTSAPATDAPSESESSGTTTTASLTQALVSMMMAVTDLQTVFAQTQMIELEASDAISSKTVEVIEADAQNQINNTNEQAANAKKQQKVHRWMKIGEWVGAVIVSTAIGLVLGPEAGVATMMLMSMSLTGATNKMFSSIDNPNLKMFTEIAFAATVAILSGGAAALAEGSFLVSAEVAGEMVASEAGELAASAGGEAAAAAGEAAAEAGASEAIESTASQTDEMLSKALNKGMKLGKDVAFMEGTQALLSTPYLQDYSQQLMNIFFTMLHLDKDSKAAKITVLALETAMAIAVAVASVVMAGGMEPSERMNQKAIKKAGVGLLAAGNLLSLGTDGLNIDSGAISLNLAALQKQQSDITASMQQALMMNKYNLAEMQQEQEEGRQKQEAIGQSMESWRYFSAPIQAAAQALLA